MPRKSAASLAVCMPSPAGKTKTQPPSTLSADAAAEWTKVATGKPASWLTPDVSPLLESYVCAVVAARTISKCVDDALDKLAEPGGMARYVAMLKTAEQQARLVATLATKLRLTPQSQITAKAAHAVSRRTGKTPLWDQGREPWEDQ